MNVYDRRQFLKTVATAGIISLSGCANSSSTSEETPKPEPTVSSEPVTSTPTDTATQISIDVEKVTTEDVPTRPYNYYPYIAGKYKMGGSNKADKLNTPDAEAGSINKLPTIVERLRPVTFLNIDDSLSTDKIESDGGWFSRKHLEEYETNYAAKKRYELMKSILPAQNQVEEFEIDQCPNPWLIISLEIGGDYGIEPYYAVTASGNLYLQTGIKDPDAYENPVSALKEQLRTGEPMTSSEFQNIWPPIVRLAGEHKSNNSLHKIDSERNETLEETVGDISTSSAKEAVRTVYPNAKIPSTGIKEVELSQGPEIPVDTYQAYGWTTPSLESYTPPVAYAKSNLPEYSGDRNWTFYINYLCIKFDDKTGSETYIKKLFEWADVGYSNERPYLGATSESYGMTYRFTNRNALPDSPVPFSGKNVTLSGSVCVVSDWILNPT